MVTASHNPPRGQRLQGLPRRRLADRAAGRRRDRRRDREVAVGRVRADAPTTAGTPSTTRCSTPTSTTCARSCCRTAPREVTVVHTAAARGGVRDGAPGVPRGRLRGADPGGRRRPSPTRCSRPCPSPTRRSRARWMPRSSSPSRPQPDVVIANDPDADRCAVAVPGPRRVADAARRRGGRAARLARAVPRCGRWGAAGLGRLRLRQLDRLVAPARGDVPRGRGAARGDADRVQVDRAGAGAALRLRGGARLLRRPGAGCATRTASPRPCWSPSWWRR